MDIKAEVFPDTREDGMCSKSRTIRQQGLDWF